MSGRIVRLCVLLSTTVLGGFMIPAFAQNNEDMMRAGQRLFSSSEMIAYSLVVSVLSATLFSIVWLVRQRGNIEAESNEYRAALSDAGRRISTYEALITDRSRRIVVWDTSGEQPEFIGQLPPETGAPQADQDFLGFGRWLGPSSAGPLEKAIEELRARARSFDLTVETQRGEVIEVQGRVSGGKAFARFVALNNLRAELAEMKIERERLICTISAFHDLLDAVDPPVWRRSLDGELCWVNRAYSCAVEGQAAEQSVKERRELLNTAARQTIQAAQSPYRDRISAVIAGNRTIFDVIEIKTMTGSAGIAIDCSEAEATRAELTRTIKSHAETLDHLATPVAIFDRGQRLQFYNQAFVRLWGLDVVFLESRPDNSEVLDRLRTDGKLPEQLNWKSWKEAALSVYRSVDTKTDLWHLPNGQTLRVIATAHPQGGATWVFENLTEQVDLQTRYNTLVKVQGETIDHLAEGVAVFGADGRIRLSNPTFRALWAISCKEAEAGTHIRAIEAACAPSYDKPDGWKAFSQFITSFEDARPSRQGTLELNSGLVLDYAIIPLSDAQTMLTFVNVTDSVTAERALKDKNEALRKADKLKNDFVQHVSYELRSPLTNIIGFTDLLKTPGMGDLSERQAEYLDHISTSSSVLLTIVNDILDLATVDAGIMHLNYSDRDLNDLLKAVSVEIVDRFQESNVSLQIAAPAHLGKLVADHQRLKQIFIKLLTNAANFAPEGSAILLTCQRSEGNFVFSVADKGPGIPEDMLKTVFDRFVTRGNGGRRSGAGLGLSIVESFVNLHRGQVEINSRPGEGTVVTCRIPAGNRPLNIAAE